MNEDDAIEINHYDDQKEIERLEDKYLDDRSEVGEFMNY